MRRLSLLLALALPAALTSGVPAAAALPVVTTAAYHGVDRDGGCLYVGCSFEAHSTVCLALTNGGEVSIGRYSCQVNVSGWWDPNADALYNATLSFSDGVSTYPTVPLRYNGVSYQGVARAANGDVVTVSGTIVMSPPSGDLDPPPQSATLTGTLVRG